VEYRLRSFAPWLASISLDMAVEDDVVQDPVYVVFIISKNSYNTKPTVILHFSTPGVFWLWPTVLVQSWAGRLCQNIGMSYIKQIKSGCFKRLDTSWGY
jgi:hypothetical protein